MALLPDPTPRERQHILISVDDHLIEPPDLFEGRMPAALAERAPRIVETDGRQVWLYEDRVYPNIGLNAVVGRPQGGVEMEPAGFDEMRRGCWDIDARIADMDLAGIWASRVLPVADRRVLRARCSAQSEGSRARAARACGRGTTGTSRCGPAPTRTASSRCRSRGWPTRSWPPTRCAATPSAASRRVSFAEMPAQLGLPVAAHRALGPVPRRVRGDRHRRLPAHRLGVVGADPRARPAVRAVPDAVPGERPRGRRRLAVVGCARSVPGAAHRARRGRHRLGGDAGRPRRLRPRPLGVGRRGRGVERRPAAERGAAAQLLVLHDRRPVGARRARRASAPTTCCVESDYPHADSTWPDTQHVVARNVAKLSADDAASITHRNAAALFRHPLPDDEWLPCSIS